MFPQDAQVTPEEDGFTLSFTLPKGSFATSVLREVMKTSVDAAAPELDGTGDEEAAE